MATSCAAPSEPPPEGAVLRGPERFTIVPDDYHVPYAGTAGDGRKFFLSEELFADDVAYVEVEPFTQQVDGVTFGWKVDQYDGTYSVNLVPGDFIAYYAPWDGREYDT